MFDLIENSLQKMFKLIVSLKLLNRILCFQNLYTLKIFEKVSTILICEEDKCYRIYRVTKKFGQIIHLLIGWAIRKLKMNSKFGAVLGAKGFQNMVYTLCSKAPLFTRTLLC